jgi:hypothetical protein
MVALHAHGGEWCLHRAPIAVLKPTSRYLLPPLGVELPLHPSTSALVLTASARALPAVYPLRFDCIPFSLVTKLNSVCREPSEI